MPTVQIAATAAAGEDRVILGKQSTLASPRLCTLGKGTNVFDRVDVVKQPFICRGVTLAIIGGKKPVDFQEILKLLACHSQPRSTNATILQNAHSQFQKIAANMRCQRPGSAGKRCIRPIRKLSNQSIGDIGRGSAAAGLFIL